VVLDIARIIQGCSGPVVPSVLLGITYAGIANIMLNGLGVVLSQPESPGFLPGMNSAAFNFGAGLSFAVLPVVQVLGGANSTTGFAGGIWLGLVITALALSVSFLIPRPASAEVEPTPVSGHVGDGRSGTDGVLAAQTGCRWHRLCTVCAGGGGSVWPRVELPAELVFSTQQ